MLCVEIFRKSKENYFKNELLQTTKRKTRKRIEYIVTLNENPEIMKVLGQGKMEKNTNKNTQNIIQLNKMK